MLNRPVFWPKILEWHCRPVKSAGRLDPGKPRDQVATEVDLLRPVQMAAVRNAASVSTSLISFSSKISRRQFIACVSARFSGGAHIFQCTNQGRSPDTRCQSCHLVARKVLRTNVALLFEHRRPGIQPLAAVPSRRHGSVYGGH